MELISCDNCGAVLDKKKLNFPTEYKAFDDSLDLGKADYNRENERYEPFIWCPVCNGRIFQGVACRIQNAN